MLPVPRVTKDEYEQLEEGAKAWLLRTRYRALKDAGIARGEAAVVAAHPEVDLQEAFALLSRGCPARTALRILL